MNKLFSRIMIVLTLVAVLAGALAFGPTKARAADGTFNVSVYHGINGRALGLSKELPVIATVEKDGQLLALRPNHVLGHAGFGPPTASTRTSGPALGLAFVAHFHRL